MSRFGIFSFPGTGHLHPLTALGRACSLRSSDRLGRTVRSMKTEPQRTCPSCGNCAGTAGPGALPFGNLFKIGGNLAKICAASEFCSVNVKSKRSY